MKRLRFPVLVLCIALLVGTAVYAVPGATHGVFEGFPIVRVLVNGVAIRGDVPAINFRGRTMVPVRFVSEALGAEVGWDADTWTASIALAGTAELQQQVTAANARIAELERENKALLNAVTGVLAPSSPLLPGLLIIANDGQYLGVISTDRFASDSIMNEFGTYGSRFSAYSIMNRFGAYGSGFSPLSPFNDFAATPPVVVSGSGPVAYLTTNRLLVPRVDPHALIGFLMMRAGR
jgi:hypothetical protein